MSYLRRIVYNVRVSWHIGMIAKIKSYAIRMLLM